MSRNQSLNVCLILAVQKNQFGSVSHITRTQPIQRSDQTINIYIVEKNKGHTCSVLPTLDKALRDLYKSQRGRKPFFVQWEKCEQRGFCIPLGFGWSSEFPLKRRQIVWQITEVLKPFFSFFFKPLWVPQVDGVENSSPLLLYRCSLLEQDSPPYIPFISTVSSPSPPFHTLIPFYYYYLH